MSSVILTSMFKTFVVFFSLITVVAASERGERWSKYTNQRCGFRLTYPASLIASREPDNGDGREFHSSDREFSVTASGHFFVLEDESLESVWQEEIGELGGTAHYKRKTKNWFVISGVKNGCEYYRKFYASGGSWVLLRINYPHTKRYKYDPWVVRIEKNFTPFKN